MTTVSWQGLSQRLGKMRIANGTFSSSIPQW